MLDKLRSLLAGPARPREAAPDLALAVAALLVEAARADEVYDDREKEIIDAALAEQFGLAPGEAAALRARAEEAQAQANDLHKFTKIAKTMDAAHKIQLVERLWRIVLSDSRRDPHEDSLIRRVCSLIYVADPESGAARHRAERALQSEENRPA